MHEGGKGVVVIVGGAIQAGGPPNNAGKGADTFELCAVMGCSTNTHL